MPHGHSFAPPVEQCPHLQSGLLVAQEQLAFAPFGAAAGAAGAVAAGAAAGAAIATSVMPHFGHLPGAFIFTSGCIGHVYTVAAAGAAVVVSCIIAAVSFAGSGAGAGAAAGAAGGADISGAGTGGGVDPPQAENKIAEAIASNAVSFFMETSVF